MQLQDMLLGANNNARNYYDSLPYYTSGYYNSLPYYYYSSAINLASYLRRHCLSDEYRPEARRPQDCVQVWHRRSRMQYLGLLRCDNHNPSHHHYAMPNDNSLHNNHTSANDHWRANDCSVHLH